MKMAIPDLGPGDLSPPPVMVYLKNQCLRIAIFKNTIFKK
jgi:hypothetical protein